ncbi:MAG: type VI secretion system baseplate subunit TssE [Syntrophaceae bacterium]
MSLFWGKTSSAPGRGRSDDLGRIVENLNRILNTKRGYGSFVKDFGISDLNEYTSRDVLVKVIMQEVKDNIECYEPRLQIEEITVEDNNDPFRISFSIRCYLKETRQALVMEFNSIYSNFKVRNPGSEAADV